MLNEIKIKTIKNGITMAELSKKLGISREYMYRKIKSGDTKILEDIKKILGWLGTNVYKINYIFNLKKTFNLRGEA